MLRRRLEYLVSRLNRVDDLECVNASAVIVDAMAKCPDLECTGIDEQAVYHTVWGHITRALDCGQYPKHQKMELDSLEGEMAGRVFGIRLARGTLTKPADIETKNSFLSRLRAIV